MNKIRMEALAQRMESLDSSNFDIDYWGDPKKDVVCKEDMEICGTTCCIAGWQCLDLGYCVTTMGRCFRTKEDAETRFTESSEEDGLVGLASDLAANYLGLTSYQARDLFRKDFWPEEFQHPFTSPTPQIAAKRIRHMIQTGE